MSSKIKHPKGLYFLFAVEMWERFGYYGMRSILVLYMVNYLLFSTEKAGQIYGWYTGLVYLMPLLGGYIADRYLGARQCILFGAILMVLGYFAMAFEPLPFFYTALGLIILGNGFFKPNISTVVGQLYKGNESAKDAGFTIFYMGINLGAFFSPFVCGTLGEKLNYHYGFAAAGVGMLIGTIIYLFGQWKYLGNAGLFPYNSSKIEEKPIDKPLTNEEKKKVAVIFILMFFSIFFWASFEQAGSSLTLFAKESTNRVIPFLNWEFPASYFQAINPLFIILLAPLLSDLWLNLQSVNKEPSAPAKFAFGLGFVAFGFVLMVIASTLADTYGQVGFLWLVFVYLFHTVGELCISPVGLSVVTKLAPAKFASLLMAVWFLSSFFANLGAGLFAANYEQMNHQLFFMIPAVIAGISSIILILLIKPIKKWMNER